MPAILDIRCMNSMQTSDETVIQIITGEKSVDEWDSFVENWYNLGGKDITKEMNEWWISQK